MVAQHGKLVMDDRMVGDHNRRHASLLWSSSQTVIEEGPVRREPILTDTTSESASFSSAVRVIHGTQPEAAGCRVLHAMGLISSERAMEQATSVSYGRLVSK
jgi:hypothetical protein